MDALYEALEGDAEARRTYYDEVRLHAALVQKAATASAAVPRPAPTRRLVFRPALALAASVLAVAGVFIYLSMRAPGGPEAVVASVSGVAEAGGTRLQAGDRLPVGTLVMTEPGARLVVSYVREDTRVEFSEGSRFAVKLSATGGKELDLQAGRLTAAIAPQPKGCPMLFGTPFGTAFVLSTRLGLSVNPDMARLDVEKGRVRLVRAEDGEMTEICTGQLGVIGPGLVLKPYTNTTEYVDGPVLFADQFDQGLGRWEIIVRKGETIEIQRQFSPDDKEVAKYVIPVNDNGTNGVILDARTVDRSVMLYLKEPPIRMGNIAMEYDFLYEKDYGRPDKAYAEFTAGTDERKDKKTSPERTTVHFALGVVNRHRLEHVILVDAAGNARKEIRYNIAGVVRSVDKAPLLEDDWKKPETTIGCSVYIKGMRGRVSDFSIHRLVALDRAGGEEKK